MAKHPGRDEASAGSIEVVDYDPEWPALFEAEAERIRAACGRVVVEIEHIGSTSVPGLAAKPIIDIMPGVEDIAGARARLEAGMRGLGYESLGEYGIPGRLYFRKGVPRSHHVHVFEVGKPEWRKHLLFRDYLRAHEEARDLAGAFMFSGLDQDKQLAILSGGERSQQIEKVLVHRATPSRAAIAPG